MGPTSKQSPSLFLWRSFAYIFPKGLSYIASSIQEKLFHKIQILFRSHSPPTRTWHEGNVFRGDGALLSRPPLRPAKARGPGACRTVYMFSLTDQHMSSFIAFLPQAYSLHLLELSWCHFFFFPQSANFPPQDSRQQVCHSELTEEKPAVSLFWGCFSF